MFKFGTKTWCIALSAAALASCSEFDFEEAAQTRNSVYTNTFVETFGAINPDHTWNDLNQYTAEITIGNYKGDDYKVAVYLGDPRTMEQAGLIAYSEDATDGSTVKFTMDAPQGTTKVYVAIFDSANGYEVREVKVDGSLTAKTTFEGKGTRASHPNNNQWFDPDYYNLEEPATITDAEREYVMEYFRTHTKADGEGLDLNDYFIELIGFGGHEYTVTERTYESYDEVNDVHKWREEEKTLAANDHMDFIYANLDAEGATDETRDHIFNKNNGSGEIMLMQESETKYGFGFHDSYGTDDNYYSHNYWLTHITGTASDGTVIDGWYVGFDYQATKKGTYGVYDAETDTWSDVDYVMFDLQPDGYYDDRVEKIVPAKSKTLTPPDPKEDAVEYIIAFEDLGGTDDFDFNDIVISVSHVAGSDEGTVRLKAAGGTLEAYIMYNGTELGDWIVNNVAKSTSEVHSLYEVPVSTMVNTGRGSMLKWDIQTSISFPKDATITGHAKDFGIKVVQKDGTATVVKFPDPSANAAPQAILIADPNWAWPLERISILDAYPEFQQWVSDPAFVWYGKTWSPSANGTKTPEVTPGTTIGI